MVLPLKYDPRNSDGSKSTGGFYLPLVGVLELDGGFYSNEHYIHIYHWSQVNKWS